MRWFKHFADNHRGRSIQDLLDQLGHTGLCYYLLMEMCAEKLESDSDKGVTEAECLFHFHTRLVRQTLRISPTNLRRLLDVCAANGLLSFQISGNSLEISMPILLDLLERNTKKAKKRRQLDAKNSPLEVEEEVEEVEGEEDKEVEIDLESSSTVLEKSKPAQKESLTKEVSFSNDLELWSAIPINTKARWMRLYDTDYLAKELIRAFNHYETNSRKTPKTLRGWMNALSSWFERGWSRHVVKIKSERNTTDMFSKIDFGDEAS